MVWYAMTDQFDVGFVPDYDWYVFGCAGTGIVDI